MAQACFRYTTFGSRQETHAMIAYNVRKEIDYPVRVTAVQLLYDL